MLRARLDGADLSKARLAADLTGVHAPPVKSSGFS
jgi:hypothetical protein